MMDDDSAPYRLPYLTKWVLENEFPPECIGNQMKMEFLLNEIFRRIEVLENKND